MDSVVIPVLHTSLSFPFFCLIISLLAVLSPCCCVLAVSSSGKWGYSLAVVRELLTAGASLVMENRLKSVASVAAAHGLSCPVACGITLDQGSNLCPLNWQLDS